MNLNRFLMPFLVSIFFLACSGDTDNSGDTDRRDIPDKITILFVTQPHCPSCDTLESTMKLEKPSKLIKKYFKVKKVNIGERLPKGLVPPNGTPTLYFLGYNNEPLLEPIIGEKNETRCLMFLNEALEEFKKLYGVDLRKGKDNESNSSEDND